MSAILESSRALSPRPRRGAGIRRLVRAALLLTAVASCMAAAPLAARAVAAAQAAATAKPVVDRTVKVAPGLYEIVVSRSMGLVYVASIGSRQEPGSAKIVGLDPKTLEVKQTIAVAEAPAYGLGLNDKTQMLYTSNTRSGNVSAIDLKASKIVSTIKVEAEPRAHLFRVLVNEDKNLVYVSVTSGKIWVIDGKTNQLSHIIEEVGKTTVGLALDAAGNRLFAANMGSADIAVIDLAARKVVTRFPTGSEDPTMLAYDAKSKRLFVTNQGTGDVTALDTTDGKVLKSVKTGDQALGIGLNPDTNLLYVANRRASTITVLDARTLDVVANLTAGSLPNTVAIDATGGRVYVTNKAKSGGRNAPPVDDPAGDTVTLVTH